MNIYFAGSIRGAAFEGKAEVYQAILNAIQETDRVISEHAAVTGQAEALTDTEIFKRDMDWILDSALMIAEVSAPSLGVGYEIAFALHWTIPVLCLHKRDVKISAMIAGNDELFVKAYDTPEEAAALVREFIRSIIVDLQPPRPPMMGDGEPLF